jgi:hypothetical protein
VRAAAEAATLTQHQHARTPELLPFVRAALNRAREGQCDGAALLRTFLDDARVQEAKVLRVRPFRSSWSACYRRHQSMRYGGGSLVVV